MDAVSEARLQLVAPQLADKIRQLDTRLAVENINIRVTFGLRTASEQKALYAQGRKSLADVNALRKVAGLPPIVDADNFKVTNAPAGYSWHEYGMAVDVVPMVAGKADWNVAHPQWARIVAVGESLGLTSGISWQDEPHLQLQGKFPVGAPNDECRTLLLHGGMKAVWDAAYS